MASATIGFNAIVLEVLNQHNYKEWCSRVETYLLAEDLWDVVVKPPPEWENAEAEVCMDWRRKNAKALHAIKISCGTDIFSNIREVSTAKTAWEILEESFKSGDVLRLERKEREEKERSTAKGANGAGQTRDYRELVSPDEDMEIKASNEGGYENNAGREFNYKPFFDHVVNGDWDQAKEYLARADLHAVVKAQNPETGCTALHTAVNKGHVNIVKELVSLMREEDLEITDQKGFTALGATIVASDNDDDREEDDFIQMARYMVEKNRNILTIAVPPDQYLPVVKACSWSKWNMTRYLYSVTSIEHLLSENGTHGAELITKCIRRANGLDIAWDLLQRHPRLAIVHDGRGGNPMLVLAQMRYAFLSGEPLTFWQKWIYHGIHIEAVGFNIRDSCINVSKSYDDRGNQRDLIFSVTSLFRRLIGNVLKLLGIIHLYEMKSIHVQVQEFLSTMGNMTKNMENVTLAELNVVTDSIFKAIEQGHVEFITHMCKANPALVDTLDEKGRNIFQYAVECRQEGIYNLIYGIRKEKRRSIAHLIAKFGNNMLHSVANLSPVTRLDHIQGASLQMQRELQWFKEVESVVPTLLHRYLNSHGLIAHELFTKNHRKLKKEAEISMKGTATSCTTVGALIVTIMFAVAFTVPGGTNNDTGLPMFMHRKLFKIFIVSDTISLVSSATSVFTFLGILTSRYAEYDFLKSLPTKMIVGLSTLFLSIVAMMITFSCALTMMLDGEAWIIILSMLFASIPVISFVWLLFPLLIEISSSTYGPGIFDRKVKPWC